MLRATSRGLCGRACSELAECSAVSFQNCFLGQHLHTSAAHADDAAAATAEPAQASSAAAAEGKNDSAARSKLLQQQRVQHRAALHRLRKQWGDQQAALRQQKQAAAVKRAAAAAAAKAEAKGRREAKQRAEAKEEQLHLQEEAQERELLRIEAAKRRHATEAVYDMYKEDRIQWLVGQSRNWIAPGQLDQRIEWALSNPQPLGGTASWLYAEEQRRQHRQQTAERESMPAEKAEG